MRNTKNNVLGIVYKVHHPMMRLPKVQFFNSLGLSNTSKITEDKIWV